MFVLMSNDGNITFDEVKEYEGQPVYLAMKHCATDFMVMVKKLRHDEYRHNNKEVYFYIDTSKRNGTFWEPCVMLYMLKSFEQADAIILSHRILHPTVHQMITKNEL